MNDLQIYNYRDSVLRTIERDGELWWVLKDVCDVLGIKNSRDVVNRLDPDEKGVGQIDTLSGSQNMTIINEPGLYNVIMRSDKPEAKDFKRWVTHEVLPAIRRTGTYTAPAMTPAQLLAAQAQVLVDMERRMSDMQDQVHALETKVDNAIKVFSRPAQDHWKADMDAAIMTLCQDLRLSPTATRGRMYAELRLQCQRPPEPPAGEEEKGRHEIPRREGADQAGRHRGGQAAPCHFRGRRAELAGPGGQNAGIA